MLTSRFQALSANVRGAFWMLTAGMLFSVMMAAVKILGGRLPSFEIVFFRSTAQLLILFPIIWRMGFAVLRTRRRGLQGVRAVVAVVLINCNFYAFTQLPLVDVTAISFSRALFVTVLAILFLNERVGRHRWLATLVGFAGILIILRPGQGGLDPVMLIALVGAAMGASMTVMVRKLSEC